ncbi:MAG: NUDIX hydrolase [Candidatus Liptonbacteria bacterium]|nr:NUDIX hydrolase [Candidatus Liptonbacteria bacterium]
MAGDVLQSSVMSEDAPKESQKFINLGVVFNNRGEVLMIRRVKEEDGRDGTKLTWAFPGGKQRLNESRADCVKREVLAETGYEIKQEREISMRVHPNFLVLVVYHLCSLVSPKPVAEPQEPHEVGEIKWIKPGELEKLITTDLDPGVRKILGISN